MPSTARAFPVHANVRESSVPDGTCRRWKGRSQSWVRTRDGGFNPDHYEVRPLDEQSAKRFVVEHHYSGTYPAAARRYGLFDRRHDQPALVGVAVLSIPAQARVLTNVFPDLDPYRESLELGRFCLLGGEAATTLRRTADREPAIQAPAANAESWFLARCLRMLARDGIRGVVSFADPVPRRVKGKTLFPGHVGIIYQASNAVYTGRGTARTLTVLPDGTSLSDRALQKVRTQEQGHEYVERRLVAMGARALTGGARPAEWLTEALDDVKAVRLRHRGNLRYAMATSRRDKALLPLGGPYLKWPDRR